ncbi:histidine phosphatase superfamily [Desarmillaria tabescens]|uniref:Histidine phosphatase superfamily n=1 Tax=Armillaria tabescens TaxID=1929756 RepID=A0AA39JYF2_ARMTA|nr:histidine phosphatase superfamily [Desarmillaria tabescens]KAK0449769.1 histidine phosphatase superfamily [Desarmillaria tabescens]
MIYASPLLRAHHTGKAVQDGQPNSPPLVLNPNLREQHFGIAEGYPWCYTYPDHMTLDECYKNNIFPAFFDRSSKFPDGESVEDLAERAHGAIKECIFPHLAEEDGFHVALASHGLCIGELIHALLSYDPNSSREESYLGLMNTAWTRAVISLDPSHQGPVDSNNPPPLSVGVTHIGKTDHLTDLVSISRLFHSALKIPIYHSIRSQIPMTFLMTRQRRKPWHSLEELIPIRLKNRMMCCDVAEKAGFILKCERLVF